MKLVVLDVWIVVFCLTLCSQCVSKKECVCELKNVQPFPTEKLDSIHTDVSECNRSITPTQVREEDVLVLGLQQRIRQLEESVSVLEKEDDGDLYGAVSLRIIELEFAEILELMVKLNMTISSHQQLSESTGAKLLSMMEDMEQLEALDSSQVVRKEQEIQQLKKQLAEYQNERQATVQPPTPRPVRCPQGHLVNVSGPRIYTLSQYGTSYSYGAWGKDPKPVRGKENMYWIVVMTSSSVYANYVRLYSSLNTILAGVELADVVIASSNPTTNTINGANVVMYGGALYYGCYNERSVCRFNMSDSSVSKTRLPETTGINNKFPFGRLDTEYVHTDLDFSTDESGVWVVYATPENYGNVILSKVTEGVPPSLGQTWHTSLHKRTASNTFMACGILYATRFVNSHKEEIFYSFDTETGEERYNLKIQIKKTQTTIETLNYDPQDRKLYGYSDAYMLLYDVEFQ